MSEMGKIIPFPMERVKRRQRRPVVHSIPENKAWAKKRIIEILKDHGEMRSALVFEKLREERQLPIPVYFIALGELKRKGIILEPMLAEFKLADNR